jgi:conjugative transfer signal peptidase TraF
VAAVAVGGLLVATALGPAGVRLNLSPSMPVGIYLARPMTTLPASAVRRGALVAVCLPSAVGQWGRARGYLMRGSCADGVAPVGKPVFAVEGDTVVVGPAGLALGRTVAPNSRPLARDAAGRPLSHVPDGRLPVAHGEIWLVSTHTSRSWDSRYYGPVPVARVVAVLRPLLVIEKD